MITMPDLQTALLDLLHEVKLPAHRAGLPGNVDMIIGSAFLPAYKAGHPADLPVTTSLTYKVQGYMIYLHTKSFGFSDFQPQSRLERA